VVQVWAMIRGMMAAFKEHLELSSGDTRYQHKVSVLKATVTDLEVTVIVTKCIVEPATQRMGWNGKIESVSHDVKVPPDYEGNQFDGTLIIRAIPQGTDLWRTPFKVSRKPEPTLPSLQSSSSSSPSSTSSPFPFTGQHILQASHQLLLGALLGVAEPFPKRQCFALTPKPPGCELLIFVCSPSISPLPQALNEAEEIKAKCAAWTCQITSDNATAQELRGQLCKHRPRRFLFSGHGDATYMGDLTLGFARPDGGALEVVEPKHLSTLLGSQGKDSEGTLDLCFLNGCNTEALGRAAREAGVPTVVCWRTETLDGAAKLFSTVFFETVCVHGRTYREAFDEAVRAVRFVTAPSGSSSGTHMPKFKLRGPTSEEKELRAKAPYPHAAGVPVLIDALGTRNSDNV
jgi:hypothetical protein